MTIKDFMTHHHKECDELLSLVEDALDKKDFETAQANYKKFKGETLKHFKMEEEYLFVIFDEKNNMAGCGPTNIMRMEHAQVRSLFDKMDGAIESHDSSRFFDLSESMLFLLQQHNAKEEQMLYTMIQNIFGDQNDAIVQRLINYEK